MANDSQSEQIDEILLEFERNATEAKLDEILTDVQMVQKLVANRKEVKARIEQLIAQARVDENNHKLTLNIDIASSADYKAGFQDALDQIDRGLANRNAQLQARKEKDGNE